MRDVAHDTRSDIEIRFREMYSRTISDVYGFLALRAGDRALAEDLTAETYTAAVRQFNAGRAHDVTLSWLRTVARRRLIDHWRRQNLMAQKLVLLVDRLRDADVADHRRDRVLAALSTLSEAQRTSLVLHHIEGYTVAEVAEVVGRTEKATESLLGRARQAFRACYEQGTR